MQQLSFRTTPRTGHEQGTGPPLRGARGISENDCLSARHPRGEGLPFATHSRVAALGRKARRAQNLSRNPSSTDRKVHRPDIGAPGFVNKGATRREKSKEGPSGRRRQRWARRPWLTEPRLERPQAAGEAARTVRGSQALEGPRGSLRCCADHLWQGSLTRARPCRVMCGPGKEGRRAEAQQLQDWV